MGGGGGLVGYRGWEGKWEQGGVEREQDGDRQRRDGPGGDGSGEDEEKVMGTGRGWGRRRDGMLRDRRGGRDMTGSDRTGP